MPRKPRTFAGRAPINKLTILARAKNMTLAKLAKRVGLQPSTVHAYANTGVPPATVRDFASVLGVPMSEIPVHTPKPPRNKPARKAPKPEIPLASLPMEELQARIGALSDQYRAKRDELQTGYNQFVAQYEKSLNVLDLAEGEERVKLHAELDKRIQGMSRLAESLRGRPPFVALVPCPVPAEQSAPTVATTTVALVTSTDPSVTVTAFPAPAEEAKPND